MIHDDAPSTHVSISALPDLLRVLAPLRSVTQPAGLARSVAEWIVATVAYDCQVHLVKDRHLTTLVDLHRGPAPEPAVLAQVATSSEKKVIPDFSPGRIWVVLPLRADAESIGTLSMLVDYPSEGLAPSYHRGLEVVASTLARALSEAVSQQRANRVSQALQTSLLPGALPKGEWFELCARYLPGTADLRIGGDWYDSQIMPDGAVALSVGDVAGHGIEAATQMGELRSAMVALRLVRSAPDELISVVHRLATGMSYFATVICARLDPAGNLRWASAGHLPPLVIHEEGDAELLETDQSPPLGVGHPGRVPVNRYRLSPGDIVFLYTDGLIERRDRDIGESLDSLVAGAVQYSRRSIDELIDDMVKERDHPSSTGDDVAILAARWRADPPHHVPSEGRT
jgi:hypothetical protein